MPKTFCVQAFRNLYLRPSPQGDGVQMAACCYMDPSSRWKVRSIAEAVQSFYHSNYYSSLRGQFLRGEWPSACRGCEESEAKGKKSFREVNNASAGVSDSDFTSRAQQTQLESLDLRPSNLCNLKCRMCDSTNSSLVALEMRHHPEMAALIPGIDSVTGVHRLGESVRWEMLPHLQQIKLLGGEPGINPEIIREMQELIRQNRAANLELQFTTNAQTLHPEFLSALPHFKRVTANISVDGVGATYEYIRTNGKFGQLLEGILSLDSMVHRWNINFLFQMHNIFNLIPMAEFLDHLSASYEKFDRCELTVCVDPAAFNPQHLLERHRREILRDLENYHSLHSASLEFVRTCQGWLRQTKGRDRAHPDFWQVSWAFDQRRGTDLRSLDPRYVDYLGEETNVSTQDHI